MKDEGMNYPIPNIVNDIIKKENSNHDSERNN